MKSNFNEMWYDITEWLDENEEVFKKDRAEQEYALSALTYYRKTQSVSFPHQCAKESADDYEVWLLIVAQAKYVLEQKFSRQFLYALSCIFDESNAGSLISLRDIHAIYGKPSSFTPKRTIDTKKGKELMVREAISHNYRIEEVIRFNRFDVLANNSIALFYLNEIDPKNSNTFQNYFNFYDGKHNILQFLYWIITYEKVDEELG